MITSDLHALEIFTCVGLVKRLVMMIACLSEISFMNCKCLVATGITAALTALFDFEMIELIKILNRTTQ